MKKIWMIFAFLLLLAGPAFAQQGSSFVGPVIVTVGGTAARTRDSRNFCSDMRAFIKVLSGTPTVTLTGKGPSNDGTGSDAFTIGTLSSGTTSLAFVGPFDKITATATVSGSAEVSWGGLLCR